MYTDEYQGRRQDFAKGGADARRDMLTLLRLWVSGPPGGLGAARGSGGH